MMFSRNLREDYLMLRELCELCEERNEKDIAMNKVIQSIKGRIRRTLQEQVRHAEEDAIWHYPLDGYDDSRWCKFVYEELPEEWQHDMTREEAIKKYKKDEWWHWYNPYEDGRDCTGVWFTRHIAVFPIPAEHKTIVYHFQSCDV